MVALELSLISVVAHVLQQVGFVHKTLSTNTTNVRPHIAVSLHFVRFQIPRLVEVLAALLALERFFLLRNVM